MNSSGKVIVYCSLHDDRFAVKFIRGGLCFRPAALASSSHVRLDLRPSLDSRFEILELLYMYIVDWNNGRDGKLSAFQHSGDRRCYRKREIFLLFKSPLSEGQKPIFDLAPKQTNPTFTLKRSINPSYNSSSLLKISSVIQLSLSNNVSYLRLEV